MPSSAALAPTATTDECTPLSAPHKQYCINLDTSSPNDTAVSATPSSPPPKPHLETSQSALFTGYSAMVMSAFVHSFAMLLIRTAQDRFLIPTMQVLFISFFSGGLLLYIYISLTIGLRRALSVTWNQFGFMMIRSLVGGLSAYLYFKALSYTNMGDAAASFNISPMMTSVFAALLLHEPIRSHDFMSLVVSLFGVFLITRPSDVGRSLMLEPTEQNHFLGTMLAASSGIVGALAVLPIRHLKSQVHYMTPPAFLFPSLIILTAASGGVPKSADLVTYGLGTLAVAVAGASFTVSQVLLSLSLQKCPAGPALLIRNIDIPLDYVMGLLFLGEHPTLLRAGAALLIIASTMTVGVINLYK